jgi:hypothetical protein
VSEKLRNAISTAGPDAVETVHNRLQIAGQLALAYGDARGFLYRALASSMKEPDGEDDVWPGLISAVYTASTRARASSVVFDVIEEMRDPESDVDANGLPAALSHELTTATLAYVLLRLGDQRDVDSLDRGIPPEWTES